MIIYKGSRRRRRTGDGKVSTSHSFPILTHHSGEIAKVAQLPLGRALYNPAINVYSMVLALPPPPPIYSLRHHHHPM